MADKRPDCPEGYLGGQPQFGTVGLSTSSHSSSEIEASDNKLEIKFKAANPVKVTHQLVKCKDGSDVSEYVFTQTKDKTVSFVIHMPESGWYKLQIYGLRADDDSKSLPNVFNYLINCAHARSAVYPFPKQYAQWKDGCYLYEPLVLNSHSSLVHVNWKVSMPKGCNAVAVVADGEWHHFTQKGDNWEASFNLDKIRGKENAKVTLNANFGEDKTKFSTLLEYKF